EHVVNPRIDLGKLSRDVRCCHVSIHDAVLEITSDGSPTGCPKICVLLPAPIGRIVRIIRWHDGIVLDESYLLFHDISQLGTIIRDLDGQDRSHAKSKREPFGRIAPLIEIDDRFELVRVLCDVCTESEAVGNSSYLYFLVVRRIGEG